MEGPKALWHPAVAAMAVRSPKLKREGGLRHPAALENGNPPGRTIYALSPLLRALAGGSVQDLAWRVARLARCGLGSGYGDSYEPMTQYLASAGEVLEVFPPY